MKVEESCDIMNIVMEKWFLNFQDSYSTYVERFPRIIHELQQAFSFLVCLIIERRNNGKYSQVRFPPDTSLNFFFFSFGIQLDHLSQLLITEKLS